MEPMSTQWPVSDGSTSTTFAYLQWSSQFVLPFAFHEKWAKKNVRKLNLAAIWSIDFVMFGIQVLVFSLDSQCQSVTLATFTPRRCGCKTPGTSRCSKYSQWSDCVFQMYSSYLKAPKAGSPRNRFVTIWGPSEKHERLENSDGYQQSHDCIARV